MTPSRANRKRDSRSLEHRAEKWVPVFADAALWVREDDALIHKGSIGWINPML